MTRALVIVLALSACAPPGVSLEQMAVNTAVSTANTTRLAIETSEAMALVLYRAEQVATLERLRAAGGSRDSAVAAISRVRADWQRVWAAIDKAHAAHAALVSALSAYEAGKETAVAVAKIVQQLAAAQSDVAQLLASVRGIEMIRKVVDLSGHDAKRRTWTVTTENMRLTLVSEQPEPIPFPGRSGVPPLPLGLPFLPTHILLSKPDGTETVRIEGDDASLLMWVLVKLIGSHRLPHVGAVFAESPGGFVG